MEDELIATLYQRINYDKSGDIYILKPIKLLEHCKMDYETDIFKARNGGKRGDRALLNPRKFRRRQLDNQSVCKERGQTRESPSILQCLNDVQIIIFSSKPPKSEQLNTNYKQRKDSLSFSGRY